MSHFANRLSEIVKGYPSAQDFADKCRLSRSTISRFINAKMSPDIESLSQICSIVPKELAAELIEANLLDQIPEDYRYLVSVLRNAERLREDEPLPAIFEKLKPESRFLIEEIARLCLNDLEVYDMLLRTVRLISPDWTKGQKEKPTGSN